MLIEPYRWVHSKNRAVNGYEDIIVISAMQCEGKLFNGLKNQYNKRNNIKCMQCADNFWIAMRTDIIDDDDREKKDRRIDHDPSRIQQVLKNDRQDKDKHDKDERDKLRRRNDADNVSEKARLTFFLLQKKVEISLVEQKYTTNVACADLYYAII